MAGKADERVRPTQKLSTAVTYKLSTCGISKVKGAAPKIEAHITYLNEQVDLRSLHADSEFLY